MARMKVIIAIFIIFLSFSAAGCTTHKDELRIDSFPGVKINEVICFNPTSGEIFWSCNPEQSVFLPKIPNSYKCIGFGNFSGGDKAVIFFEHNSSKNLLIGNTARNISCDCCKNLSIKGEVLKRFNIFKGLSAESPFFI